MRGPALTLLSVALWGAQPLAIALTVGRIPGSALAFYKILSALLLIGAYLVARGGVPSFRNRASRSLALLAATALGLAVSYVTYNACFRFLTPGNAQVYVLLSRIFFSLAGIFFFRETFRAAQWAGLAVLVAGLGLFFRDQLSLGDSGYLTGVALVLASALTWAVFAVGQKLLLAYFSATESLLFLYAVSTLFLLPYAEVAPLYALDATAAAALAFVCLSNVLAFVFFSESLRHWEAAKIGAVSCLTPLMTFVFMFLGAGLFPGRLHPENLSAFALFGALLVVGGAGAVAALGPKKA